MSTLSIKIGAILDSSFSSTMTGSNAQFSRLGSTIKQLNESMKPGSKFKELSHGIAAAKKSWKDAKNEVKALAEEMNKMEKPSKKLKAQFNRASASVVKARTDYLKKKEALREFREELKKSGGNIQSLISEHNRLGASVNKLRSQYNLLGSAVKAHQRTLARRAHFRSQLLETTGLALTLAAPLKAAIDHESAMSNIKAVMKFSDDKEANERGFKELGQGIKELSREIPLSAAELAQITTSGARLSLTAKKDLLEFTEIVSKMAVNFGMSAEEIGSNVSNLYSIYKMSLKDLRDLGDLVNHIASNTIVELRDLMAAINIASGAAKQFGLKIEQTAGLISALIKLGKQPKKAAAMINDMLLKLQTAREQGDEFIETLEEIGMEIEELEENTKKDPHKALLDILEILKKYGSPDILLKLFGSGAKDIALLLENSEAYGEVLNLLADKGKRANSLQEEFSDRASTTASKLQLLKNSIAEVGMNLGSIMLPALNWIGNLLRDGTQYIAQFAEKYPTVTQAIMYTIAALISLKVLAVGGGYALTFLAGTVFSFATKAIAAFSFLSTYAIPAVITGLSVLKATTLSLATSALPAVAAGVRFLTASIVSNLIGAIIALLASGAVLVISNWEKVKAFLLVFGST